MRGQECVVVLRLSEHRHVNHPHEGSGAGITCGAAKYDHVNHPHEGSGANQWPESLDSVMVNHPHEGSGVRHDTVGVGPAVK